MKTIIKDDFSSLPKLVQRIIKVVHPEIEVFLRRHGPPLDLISACFDGKLKLKTRGKTVEERLNSAKLIPNKNKNIELNVESFRIALECLEPDHLKKLLDLINELISSNSLSANKVVELFKVKGGGPFTSLIEIPIYHDDYSPNIEESTSLKSLKLILDFICNLEISELDKAKALSSVDLARFFESQRVGGVSQTFVEKRKYVLELVNNLRLQQFENPEAKDYLTKNLKQSIINATKKMYDTNIELYTMYINFILESNLFDSKTIKECIHNICSASINLVYGTANRIAQLSDKITKLAHEIDNKEADEIKKKKKTEESQASDVLATVVLLLEKIRTINNLTDADKIEILLRLKLFQGEILKTNNPEWVKSYTEQLLYFASTIEDLATKKQLFSIIVNFDYSCKINENTFKEYIKLIKDDSRLTSEDKTAIVAMLEKEKLAINDYILCMNAKLQSLRMRIMGYRILDDTSGIIEYLLDKAKNILESLENKQLVEVLSLKEGLYSNNGMPFLCSFFCSEKLDETLDELIEDKLFAQMITNIIIDRYHAGEISKEDVRKICSLDVVINNQQLKDVLRTKLQENVNLKVRIVNIIRDSDYIKGRHDIVGEILEDELSKIMD